MRDAVIVEAVRTPVGKRSGGLSGVHPVDLSAHVLEALASRSGIDPAVVDDVVWGCVSQVGEQTFNIARNAVLAAGWPETVTGSRSTGSAGRASSRCTSRRPGWSRGSTTWWSRAASSRCRGCRWAPRSAGADAVRPAVRAPRYGGGSPQPGRRRRDDRRALGPLARAAGRVLALGSHEKAAAATRRGPVRRADRAGHHGRRAWSSERRGHPPRRDGRDAGRPQDRCSSRTA